MEKAGTKGLKLKEKTNDDIRKGSGIHRSGNMLRFPRAAVEPTCARRVASFSVMQHSSQVEAYSMKSCFVPRHFVVSPMPLFPQESPHISSANLDYRSSFISDK
ncbi:hypothetical protein [Lentibacillus persicus]|uniref:hypothetical protein n=1 Tax=Lentibacillus persicus TaxID=640948 RepID=UPI000B7FCE12|nr:hypothetical protein [Lentibacillus persicus]